jgi:hypothetical protein
MIKQNPAVSDGDWYKPKIPPILLGIGTLLWELVSVVSNIDFLMSFRSENLLKMFELFRDYGWAIVTLGGAVWFFSVYNKRRKKTISPALVIVVGVLAFMWGVLLTIYAVGSTPHIIESYGTEGEVCTATFNTSPLTEFKKNYDVALICGFIDPSRDKFADTRITISVPYSIQPGTFEVSAAYGEEMRSYKKTLRIISVWHASVLLKKGTDIKLIHSLADIPKNEGKILGPDR